MCVRSKRPAEVIDVGKGRCKVYFVAANDDQQQLEETAEVKIGHRKYAQKHRFTILWLLWKKLSLCIGFSRLKS